MENHNATLEQPCPDLSELPRDLSQPRSPWDWVSETLDRLREGLSHTVEQAQSVYSQVNEGIVEAPRQIGSGLQHGAGQIWHFGIATIRGTVELATQGITYGIHQVLGIFARATSAEALVNTQSLQNMDNTTDRALDSISDRLVNASQDAAAALAQSRTTLVESNQATIDNLIERGTDSLATTTQSAIEAITSNSDRASESSAALTDVANRLRYILSNLSNLQEQVSSDLSGISQTTLEQIQTENQALLSTIREATSQIETIGTAAIADLQQAEAAADASLSALRENSERLSDLVTSDVQSALVILFDQWLSEHPIIAWIVAHPLWFAIAVPVALILVWELLKFGVSRFGQWRPNKSVSMKFPRRQRDRQEDEEARELDELITKLDSVQQSFSSALQHSNRS